MAMYITRKEVPKMFQSLNENLSQSIKMIFYKLIIIVPWKWKYSLLLLQLQERKETALPGMPVDLSGHDTQQEALFE